MKNLQLKQHEEVKGLIEDLSFKAELQLKQSELYIRKIKAVKACKIIFTSMVLTGVTVSVFINSDILKILTAIGAGVPLVLSSLDNTADNYKLNSITYKDSESVGELKEKAISILYDITYNLNSVENIQKEIDKLNMRRKKLYKELTIHSKKAEKLASKSLTENLEVTGEEEYLIPKELREIQVSV